MITKPTEKEILTTTHRALQDWVRGTRSQEFRNVENRQRVLTMFTTFCLQYGTPNKKKRNITETKDLFNDTQS